MAGRGWAAAGWRWCSGTRSPRRCSSPSTSWCSPRCRSRPPWRPGEPSPGGGGDSGSSTAARPAVAGCWSSPSHSSRSNLDSVEQKLNKYFSAHVKYFSVNNSCCAMIQGRSAVTRRDSIIPLISVNIKRRNLNPLNHDHSHLSGAVTMMQVLQ